MRLSASARHAIGVITLALMVAAPVVTFVTAAPAARATSESASRGARASGGGAPLAINIDDNVAATAPAIATAPARRGAAGAVVSAAQPTILITVLSLWLLGVACLSVRLFGGWIVARRLARRALGPVTPDIHAMARRIAGRLALERVVRVFESTAVAVPMMVGWLKPVILLPAAALSGLTPDQIEALLAHEMAHVRRHDYLVNLLQSVVETLLFYHPAVWWVSRQVREEREHCCDDLAISVCGDRVAYAAALADLAAMTTPRLALAASDGSLAARVRRILGQPRNHQTAPMGWTPPVLALLLFGALVPVIAAVRSADRPGDARTADRSAVRDQNNVASDQDQTADQLRRQLEDTKKELDAVRRRLEELTGSAEANRAELAARKSETLRELASKEQLQQKMSEKALAERQAVLKLEKMVQGQKAVFKQREEVSALENLMPEIKARASSPNANMVYLAANATLETGNVITLELRGDNGRLSLPDIRIAADGTVKLPWVGTVKVGGLTLQQCEETILKSLAPKADLLDGKPVKSVIVSIVRTGK